MSTPSTRAFVPPAVREETTSGLPPDLLVQAGRRLRVQALLYAFAFTVSELASSAVFPEARAYLFSSPVRWGVDLASVLIALAVAAATFSTRIAPARVMTLGLVFEVVASYGIAAAQYMDGATYTVQPPWAGLSWVAVWVLAFTVTVPNPPRRALVAAIASVSAVPVTVGLVMAFGQSPVRFSTAPFVVALVVPYLLVVVIAYVGARVVYNLGTELKRARELGSYRLVERLGQGGMGEVWRAEHRLLARPAAVKLMRPEVVGALGTGRHADFHTRFEREAQATASLRSPYTVDLYDFGVASDGAWYYVMELLDGLDLGALVERNGPVPAERAAHFLVQVCHSLDEAHGQGLIHRDIKPSNIYACRQGRDVDVVKVLDFGLVKRQGPDEVSALDLSREGPVGGTPAFMAPEQALGDRPLDGRADIYAVGCVAYWLVTGQRVFSGSTAMETMLQHVQATPVPPSQRTELAVPVAFENLILSCLAKDPDDRPATAEDLRSRLIDQGIATAWTQERARRWWALHAPPGKNSRSVRPALG